jgi:hypothetical protein
MHRRREQRGASLAGVRRGTSVASFAGMRIRTMIALLLGGFVIARKLLDVRRRRRELREARQTDQPRDWPVIEARDEARKEARDEARKASPGAGGLGAMTDRGADVAIAQGISQVDPEPLTQMGEAVDPDAIRAAHREIPEQRERLPIPGKNVP